jgi:hypothetical protein
MAFHVPEAARDRTHPLLATTAADGNNGAFFMESPEPGWRLAVIASDGEGWEHVSVHAFRGTQMRTWRETSCGRTPTWREMCFAKETFWDGEDEVIQFHPKRSEYINMHPHTLHLWRPIGVTIPAPPSILVGV